MQLGMRGTPQLEHSFLIKLMQFLAMPTFVLDAEGKVLIWNRACERLTGVSSDEVIGTRDHWRAFYEQPRPCLADIFFEGNPEDLGALYEIHDEPDGLAFGLHAENWCVMPRRGVAHYLAIDAGPLFDDHGRLLAVVETLRDVSAQKNQQQKLEQLACLDGLTGVCNRRSLDVQWEQIWKAALESGSEVAILLLDVDHFKPFNDTLGHPIGDECLRRVAKLAQEQLHRDGDVMGRYGGEEFMVLLPGTDAAGARKVAERLRAAIESAGILHPSSPNGVVTVSVGGVAGCPTHDQSLDGWLNRVDQALYQSKRLGRNQVTFGDQVQEAANAAQPIAQVFQPNVLVVDDNRVNRLVATAMLKRLGCRCVEADSAEAALAAIAVDVRVDLVLLDISMPGMSGTALCSLFKTRADLADVNVVAYTAHAFNDKLQQIRAVGFDDVLVKPISMESLQRCLRANLADEHWPAALTEGTLPSSLSPAARQQPVLAAR